MQYCPIKITDIVVTIQTLCRTRCRQLATHCQHKEHIACQEPRYRKKPIRRSRFQLKIMIAKLAHVSLLEKNLKKWSCASERHWKNGEADTFPWKNGRKPIGSLNVRIGTSISPCRPSWYRQERLTTFDFQNCIIS